MNESDLTFRESLEVIADAARHRPRTAGTLVGLNLGVAVLNGIGVGFIVPIVDFVVGGTTGGTVQEVFVRLYRLLGIPLTLETAIAGVAFVMLLQFSLTFITAVQQATLEASYVRRLRTASFESLLAARVDVLDDIGEDSALNTLVTEARHAGSIPYRLVELLQAVLLVAAFGAVAVTIEPLLTVATVVLLGIIIGVVRFVLESGYESGDRLATANEAVQRDTRRGVAGLREIKQFVAHDRFRRAFEQSAATHAAAWSRVRRNRAAISTLQQASIALAVFGLLYVAVAVYDIGTGELAAFLFAMFRAGPQVTRIHDLLYAIESTLPHAVRVRTLARELAAASEPTGGTASVPRPIRTVAFEDVSFGYDGADTDGTLTDVSFRVTEGETVALCGPSGAGKSTLAALLARLYHPDAGQITANGDSIAEFERDDWRAAVGLVRQQPYVFDGTLRENLLLGCPDAATTSIQQACSVACVDAFLDALPNGLETELGEDAVRLSGGQRQRVAIARTLLTDPAMLVLDEATSELDAETERELLAGVRESAGDIPILLISHRQSTRRFVDREVTLTDGRTLDGGDTRDHAENPDRQR